MNTLKLTSLFAAISLMAGVALAQPPAGPGPGGPGGPGMGEGGRRGGMMMRGEEGGPAMKLMAAQKLTDLTPDQKTKLEALMQKAKAEAEAKREENKAAVEKLRAATTPEERKAAMEPLRQQREAMGKQIDTELDAILTPQQKTTLDKQAKEMREKMGERMGRRGGPGMDDGATSGPEHKRDGKWEGKKGKKEGRKGEGHKGEKPSSDDAGTSASAPNPFAN